MDVISFVVVARGQPCRLGAVGPGLSRRAWLPLSWSSGCLLLLHPVCKAVPGMIIFRGHIGSDLAAYRSFSVATVQELCESRGGRPGLSVLTSLLVSVDVKNY